MRASFRALHSAPLPYIYALSPRCALSERVDPAALQWVCHPAHCATGEATIHAATLLHGVSLLTSGVRYSLIVFLGEHRLLPPELRFTAADRTDQVQALSSVLALLSCSGAVAVGCKRVLGDSALGSLVQRTRRRVDGDAAACAVDGVACADAIATIPGTGTGTGTGVLIEVVVQRYAAPHLKPTSILARAEAAAAEAAAVDEAAEAAAIGPDAEAGHAARAADASWCFSLRALLNYMDGEGGGGGEALEVQVT